MLAAVGDGAEEEELAFEFVADDGVVFVGVDGELFGWWGEVVGGIV